MSAPSRGPYLMPLAVRLASERVRADAANTMRHDTTSDLSARLMCRVGVHDLGLVMAWVDRFPHAMDSYMDGDQSSNPYIYNPKKQQGSFVSPRSLQRVSDDVLKSREHNSANATLAAMVGTIGESGARDLHAFVEYQDQLPTWEAITTSPKTAKLPDSPGACAVMVFGGVARVDAASITPFMEYIERMEPEWQAAFAIHLAKNPAKHGVAFKSAKFRDWCYQNEDIL